MAFLARLIIIVVENELIMLAAESMLRVNPSIFTKVHFTALHELVCHQAFIIELESASRTCCSAPNEVGGVVIELRTSKSPGSRQGYY